MRPSTADCFDHEGGSAGASPAFKVLLIDHIAGEGACATKTQLHHK